MAGRRYFFVSFMDNVFKAFEKFLLRDLSFLLGGSVVLASVMYICNKLPNKDTPSFKYFILAGVSYAVGYSIQELFTLPHIVRTKADLPTCWLGRFLYCCFYSCPEEWFNPRNEYLPAKLWLYTRAPQRFRDDHERTESLKQVGTTLGPCFLLAGVALLVKARVKYECVVSLGLIFAGCFLVLLGWLKVTQQAQELIDLFRKLRI